MQVTIAPASNKTSTAAIRSLLSPNSGVQIKGLYRDLKKVPDEFNSSDNFTAVQGDVGDVNTLDFSGSDAVLMVLPPAYDGRDIVEHAQRISNNVKTAIEKAGGVRRVVLLSSVGAEYSEGVGELKTNHISEQVLRTADIFEVIIIRCSYFIENWTMSVETLKGPNPFFFSTITPLDFNIAMVAIKDIGEALATQLTRDWTPPSKPYIMELHGPEPYSPLDVQKAFSQALDRDVEIKAVEREDLAEYYGKMFAPHIVNEWVEMSTCFLPGGIAEKDLSKPSDVDVIHGKTTLDEALREATAELRK
ncbi:nucleoside-diphosphate-sugar epimerase [Fusarium tjaetaba]|uniref:Nucleoside-diphosphate-sugar epimerase n=1 Tax=Fusarium tjaetaba TaxID=1567544 RepID=A0A8H5RI80_9HYPO|nr:nucleoside-diphosphate-sugar epimerase [Fusarium tjaetaba]KAF5632421.1 nucleoside-diphosphate-sugar epimerase [Fusarium tjaetaba]